MIRATYIILAYGEQTESDQFKAMFLPIIYENIKNLNIMHYIQYEVEIEIPDLQKELDKLLQSQVAFSKAQGFLKE